MQQADQTYLADVNPSQFTPSGQSEADKSLLVKFFVKPRQDRAASARQNRPIFKDVEYIDIKIPGNRNAGACRPATDADKRRFPDHYRAFKDRISQDVNEGTPLLEWPLMSRSMAQELAFFHVKTVEQLATMSDTQAARFMGISALREKARVWLENAEKEKPLFDMDKKIKEQQQEIEELKSSLNEMIQRVDLGRAKVSEETPQQKRRGTRRAVERAKEQVSS